MYPDVSDSMIREKIGQQGQLSSQAITLLGQDFGDPSRSRHIILDTAPQRRMSMQDG